LPHIIDDYVNSGYWPLYREFCTSARSCVVYIAFVRLIPIKGTCGIGCVHTIHTYVISVTLKVLGAHPIFSLLCGRTWVTEMVPVETFASQSSCVLLAKILISYRRQAEDTLISTAAACSSPLVFARFQYVTLCQQFVPIFLASCLAIRLLEFEQSKMGVAPVLC
jgi:hypothetical protein